MDRERKGGAPMRELTIGKNDAGARLDRFVSKALPLLPPALLQKYIRIKRIKVNGARAQRDQRLAQGDVVQLYIKDASSPDATVNPKLCGFRRVHLDRNEEREIQIDLPASALQVCSDEGVWHRGSGRWDLYAAFGQPDPRTQELTGKSAAHCVIE